MSLADQQRVVARLMMSAPYRRAFFAAPPDAHAEYGLGPEEFAALKGLDERRIALFNGVFAMKRFDYLVAAFPRTLALLESLDPQTRARYAEEVPLVDEREVEYANFHRWARARAVPPEAKPRLEALADFERLARSRPLAPRGRPFRLAAETRPRPSGAAVVAAFPLDLPALLDGADADPRPTRVLAWNDEGRARAERLDPEREALLLACDGTATLAVLEEKFGPDARACVGRWMESGVLLSG